MSPVCFLVSWKAHFLGTGGGGGSRVGGGGDKVPFAEGGGGGCDGGKGIDGAEGGSCRGGEGAEVVGGGGAAVTDAFIPGGPGCFALGGSPLVSSVSEDSSSSVTAASGPLAEDRREGEGAGAGVEAFAGEAFPRVAKGSRPTLPFVAGELLALELP